MGTIFKLRAMLAVILGLLLIGATSRVLQAVPAAPRDSQHAIAFRDVHPEDDFYEAVRYLATQGALSGYSDGTFRPQMSITRGQLAKIIVLALGWKVEASLKQTFRDVSATDPFYSYVGTAAAHGVVSGYRDGTFRPGAKVTRGQLAKVLVRALDLAIETSGGPHFKDLGTGDPFYQYIETANLHGLLTGSADGKFRSYENVARGAAARTIYIALKAKN